MNKPFENKTIGASGFYKKNYKGLKKNFESKQRRIPKGNHASNQKVSKTFEHFNSIEYDKCKYSMRHQKF